MSFLHRSSPCLPRSFAILAAALVGIVGLAVSGCSRATNESAAVAEQFRREGNIVEVPEGSPLRARLSVETVQPREVRGTHTLPGVIEADPTKFTKVFAPASGRVEKLHVQLGDAITEGQLVATLHAPDFAQAQAEFLKARSAQKNAQHKLARQQDLFAHKVAAEREVEDAEVEAEAAQSDLDSAAAKLHIYGFDPEKTPFGQSLQLFAPVSGKVVELAAALGEFHSDSSIALLTVADLSTVWLNVSVPEKDLRFLRPGEAVEAVLSAYPGETFKGAVLTIGDLLDPDTRVAKVRVSLRNLDGRLKPGMYATVELLDFPESMVTVPTTAILQIGDGTYVYEQVKPWTFEPKSVKLGQQQDGRTIVTTGIAPGAVILAKEGVLFQ